MSIVDWPRGGRARACWRPLVASFAPLVAVAPSVAACSGAPASTIIQPVLTSPCAARECTADGACAADAQGVSMCVCAVGYAGARCERCDIGFHRDADEHCVTDKRCADQTVEPCGEHGTCADGEGVFVCNCAAGYQGARCNLCADEFAWQGRALCELVEPSGDLDGGLHGSVDASAGGDDAQFIDSGPRVDGGALSDGSALDAGDADAGDADATLYDASCPLGPDGSACACHPVSVLETFELISPWPTATDTCAAHALLTTAGMSLRSLQGSSSVQACAPSTFNAFSTRYIEIEAGPTQPAELQLRDAASAFSFKFSATLEPLALDVLANGRVMRTISVDRRTGGTLTFALDTPALTLSFRSQSPYIQRLSLDDISYTTLACR